MSAGIIAAMYGGWLLKAEFASFHVQFLAASISTCWILLLGGRRRIVLLAVALLPAFIVLTARDLYISTILGRLTWITPQEAMVEAGVRLLWFVALPLFLGLLACLAEWLSAGAAKKA